MSGFLAAFLTMVAWAAPDGHLLARQLQSADDRPPLPVATLVDTTSRLYLQPEDDLPRGPVVFEGNPYGLTHLDGQQGLTGTAEPLPRLRYVSSVFEVSSVSESSRDDHGALSGSVLPLQFVSRHRLGLDVVQALTHSLVEAWLDDDRRAGGPFRRVARERAAALMPDVPPQQRLAAYLRATVDFSSQAVAIAHEIDRTRRRWVHQGRDVCALLRPEIPLMRLWQQVFAKAVFRGRYRVVSVAGGQGGAASSPWRWTDTRQGLAAQDKKLIVDHLLQGIWTGDALEDFSALCETPRSSSAGPSLAGGVEP